MREPQIISPHLIVPVGTQIVLRQGSSTHPAGSVATIIRSPRDSAGTYIARLSDCNELPLERKDFSIRKQLQRGPIDDSAALDQGSLRRFIVYRCVVGSRAYGLSRDESDTDLRGFYLPPAELHWSLYGIPDQLEYKESEECYWELQKFLSLALKANPNILECLYTPLVEHSTAISDAILAKRHIFLSKLVFQTYNGYVMSQFKRLEQDLRATGDVKWKHAMHLIRLLLQGVSVLQQRHVPVRIAEYRSDLLAIRDGDRSWKEVNEWRLALHAQFEDALQMTKLPDVPDYEEANRLLVWARRSMVKSIS